jgi:predicted MFS family arabinose efflux permease
MSDISNPRNRASTMAPIMSAFAAGTALGPALGGFLADSVGITQTFYIVGLSYLGLTVVNQLLLTETKASPLVFPWQEESSTPNVQGNSISMRQAVANAVGQWAPLMADPRVRNVVIMNGFYWVALAGSQMTLLPLMLTDPTGLAMSATGVGQVYMGMSAVQVFGNPILAKVVDRLGKGRAIVAGSTLIAASMGMLPYCTDMVPLAATLGLWATGSTMLSTAPVAYISDIVEDGKRAQAIALLRTSGDIGFLLGATGMGALADWTGDMNVAMETSAGVLLTATGWFATRQLLTKKSLP